jgi:hypothetical protein
MTRVSIQFEFTAPAKISSHNLDKIIDVVREWTADRFGADRLVASVHDADEMESARLSLAARMNSPDLATHVEALNEFRDALQVYHGWRLHGMPDYSRPEDFGLSLRLVKSSSDSGEP